MKDLKKLSFLPLLLALAFTGVAPAGADAVEEPPASPPEDTDGEYVPVPSAYYAPVDINACGTTVTMAAGDVREVEWKVRVREDGSTVIRYRGDATVDLTRHSDQAFIDELDISGRAAERSSADQRSVSVSLGASSIIWPLSSVEADALADAGLPEFFYFEKGRLTIDLEFSEDPDVLEPVSVDIVDATRHVSDVCELLDEATAKGGS
ncbi:hypothetical protein [Arthrobacter agilis]|uniref:hypothetical protein n=1 Tax=Arthrobacter agilis TaxID=37921 RepID=UPI0027811367|nr:hypothetical protein [Arthrobacter agilis]MDQ0734434.1 hypothetical protein [Arthrobacter agilis]